MQRGGEEQDHNQTQPEGRHGVEQVAHGTHDIIQRLALMTGAHEADGCAQHKGQHAACQRQQHTGAHRFANQRSHRLIIGI